MAPARQKAKTKLAKPLENRLRAYSMVATATAAGLVAIAEPCAAEIIYTPAHGYLLHANWTKIDFNHDGIADVSFFLSSTNYKVLEREVVAKPALRSQGGIIGYAGAVHPYASALQKNATIGPKVAFVSTNAFLVRTQVSHYLCCYTLYAGAWRNVADRFLGVKFLIAGEVHYGWVRLSVGGSSRLRAGISGYAFETVANRPIRAGQISDDANETSSFVGVEDGTKPVLPGSLGMLALGAK
ncbi:MAG: hypothetical protein WAL56_07470 [Candidatus Sulfotelmatobacter sp.]